MKQSISGGGGWRIPKEDEVEVLEILLTLPKLIAKSELLSRYTFTWGRKKKRSVLVLKSESTPSTHQQIDDNRPEKLTAADADKSPSTPLCFLPSGSGSDGADKPKEPSSLKKKFKRKATDDLLEKFTGMQQQREILIQKIRAMETLRQKLGAQNLELKAKRQEINYSKNIEDFRLWNNSMNMNLDQQHYHQQITMFAPPPQPQQQQHCQQLMVDPNNGKLVAMPCSSSSNNGGRFGLFNQIDSRVKIHGETFDFMASSQPLDQSKYLVMDNDLRIRTAAAARKRRIMRMKENKNSLMAMKLSRACR
ncbi:uncharacterized protein LOC112521571 [Cynara cardunculus var. scolymus]|uniref:Uncharacterized protein n=1 Tax=Cynara cardunculus var. scolymus TaxID=59895 RepID=A0A103XGR1_CYNCS|nr:uncharacterized protein LOC112521571 [Cynara cardunculus var. scolymus]KVH90404.1 hypothetical protein Ccrd_007577 [Cynara cardunculus var. scolymus]